MSGRALTQEQFEADYPPTEAKDIFDQAFIMRPNGAIDHLPRDENWYLRHLNAQNGLSDEENMTRALSMLAQHKANNYDPVLGWNEAFTWSEAERRVYQAGGRPRAPRQKLAWGGKSYSLDKLRCAFFMYHGVWCPSHVVAASRDTSDGTRGNLRTQNKLKRKRHKKEKGRYKTAVAQRYHDQLNRWFDGQEQPGITQARSETGHGYTCEGFVKYKGMMDGSPVRMECAPCANIHDMRGNQKRTFISQAIPEEDWLVPTAQELSDVVV